MTRQFFTKWFGCVFLLALVGAGVTNAQQVDVRSSVNATTIGTEEALTYTITVESKTTEHLSIDNRNRLLGTWHGLQKCQSIGGRGRWNLNITSIGSINCDGIG